MRNKYCTENCAFRGNYVASSGNFLPTFRDNLSVPFSGSKNQKVFLFLLLGSFFFYQYMVVFLFNTVIYVFLLQESMYSYCSSMYS